MACIAISNWSRQSHRSDPSISPVKHCEWMRTNGTPAVTSPRTSASAVSTRWTPLSRSRSNPNALNIPHLVGIRVEAIRRTIPIWTVASIFIGPSTECDLLRCHCSWFGGWARDDAARAQALDFVSLKPKFFENLFIMFAEIGPAFRRYLRDTVHLNRTTDCKFQV